ncbi:MAG: methyltransferase domain-containing protein [Acetobacteraceae bacterium]|nr:methyltransferase domain-containing protein [Acetobacteraceae bacterium]
MSGSSFPFADGDLYERTMGVWSRLAGEVFLDWLAPAAGLRWLDVGCGSGAFTEAILQRTAPAEVQGIDPSPDQIAYARGRAGARVAVFQQGDARALPFTSGHFDVAVMALVLFFVPDPAKGVAEMVRVTRPSGRVAAYVWDILEGGFPYHPIREELRGFGFNPPVPPSAQVSRAEALHAAWQAAGLLAIESRTITVERGFADFDAAFSMLTASASVRPVLAGLGPDAVANLRDRLRARLQPDAAGRIVCTARANAIQGRVPD